MCTKHQPGKTTQIRRIVSEILASLGIKGEQLKVPLKTLVHHSVIVLKCALNWTPIRPRHASLSRTGNVDVSSLESNVSQLWT